MLNDRTGKTETRLLERVTTNHTFFMREVPHFHFLSDVVLPQIKRTAKDRDIRVWSAGCSSGEEAYTLAMILNDFFGGLPGMGHNIACNGHLGKGAPICDKGVKAMRRSGKIKVLIVDDSQVYRQQLLKGLSSDPSIEVVATASDPFEARDRILEFQPDVMTCDIEMPKMNGIEFIRRLLPQYPIPVVVVSTIGSAVLDALNSGAVEFVEKPSAMNSNPLTHFLTEVTAKVKIAYQAKVNSNGGQANTSPSSTGRKLTSRTSNRGIIALGSSTGGTEAIMRVLLTLPNTVPGIVIAQHIPAVFSRMFCHVLIAPGNQHMRVKRNEPKGC